MEGQFKEVYVRPDVPLPELPTLTTQIINSSINSSISINSTEEILMDLNTKWYFTTENGITNDKPWTDSETKSFIKRFIQCFEYHQTDVNDKKSSDHHDDSTTTVNKCLYWGLFSRSLTGRTGFQCQTLYFSLCSIRALPQENHNGGGGGEIQLSSTGRSIFEQEAKQYMLRFLQKSTSITTITCLNHTSNRNRILREIQQNQNHEIKSNLIQFKDIF